MWNRLRGLVLLGLMLGNAVVIDGGIFVGLVSLLKVGRMMRVCLNRSTVCLYLSFMVCFIRVVGYGWLLSGGVVASFLV